MREYYVYYGVKMDASSNGGNSNTDLKNRDKEDNECCFPKDRQQIKYHSFHLIEIIPIEKLSQLFDGLDKLYSNVKGYSYALNYRKIFSDEQSKLFQRYVLYLPPIASQKLKNRAFPCVAFHELSDSFLQIYISLSHPIPSTIILTINVYLDENVSEKINKIIYHYHSEIIEPIQMHNRSFSYTRPVSFHKESEVYGLRKLLHQEAVNFFKPFFTGYFFELIESDPSVIPSIDLFSLNYPKTEREILTWMKEDRGFLRCFNAHAYWRDCSWHKPYLLTVGNSDNGSYENYQIFANRKEEIGGGYTSFDDGIIDTLNLCDFTLIAFDRFVRLQEDHVTKLNLMITQEIENLHNNNFASALNDRKGVLKILFAFERFRVEFQEYRTYRDEFEFIILDTNGELDENEEFFKNLKERIDFRITKISQLNSLYSHEHDSILNLKNLEFNKKTQNWVLILTIIMVFFAFIQIMPILNPLFVSFYGNLVNNIVSGIYHGV